MIWVLEVAWYHNPIRRYFISEVSTFSHYYQVWKWHEWKTSICGNIYLFILASFLKYNTFWVLTLSFTKGGTYFLFLSSLSPPFSGWSIYLLKVYEIPITKLIVIMIFTIIYHHHKHSLMIVLEFPRILLEQKNAHLH